MAATGPHNHPGLRVRINSPELLEDLVTFFWGEPNAVVEQVSDDEIEVSLLGSYRLEAVRVELDLRLRAWEAACRTRGIRLEILDPATVTVAPRRSYSGPGAPSTLNNGTFA